MAVRSVIRVRGRINCQTCRGKPTSRSGNHTRGRHSPKSIIAITNKQTAITSKRDGSSQRESRIEPRAIGKAAARELRPLIALRLGKAHERANERHDKGDSRDSCRISMIRLHDDSRVGDSCFYLDSAHSKISF